MELFDIVSTLHDLSQKGAEFHEEIANLNLTVITLATALEKLEEGISPSQTSGTQSRARGGISSFKPVLKEQLTEATELLQ